MLFPFILGASGLIARPPDENKRLAVSRRIVTGDAGSPPFPRTAVSRHITTVQCMCKFFSQYFGSSLFSVELRAAAQRLGSATVPVAGQCVSRRPFPPRTLKD